MNLEEAKLLFKEYVSSYQIDNDKIKLKYDHSLRVCDLCKKIAVSLNLSDDDIKIAEMIGLLQDFGRFEQIKIYDTFNDKISVDHAVLGVQLLEKFGIDKFVSDKETQDLVKTAIINHNKTYVDDNLNERELLFSNIIRDADKIDIFYIWSESKIEYVNGNISDNIYDRVINCPIDYEQKANNLDFYVILCGLVYDINFSYSYQYLIEKKYITKIIDKVILKNNHEYARLNNIKKSLEDYLKSKEDLC